MQQVKKLGVLSVAKITALFGLLMGIVGVIIALLFQGFVPAELLATYGFVGAITWGTAISIPLAYLVIYFIGGMVGAAIYNIFTRWVGGIRVELSEVKAKPKKKKR